MKKVNISRRSFLFGGTGVLAGLGLSTLTGCQGVGDMATTGADAGNLVACSGYSSSFIQPMPVLDTLSGSVCWHLYEGLYQLDRATNEIYNGIASDDPEKVDDLAYEINLNTDKRFSDGSVVTATIVNAVLGAYMDDAVYGIIFHFIKSLRVIDTYRLRINLNYPIDVNLLKRRLCTALIFRQGSSSNGDDEKFVGTGPYVLTDASGENGQTVKFTPNGQYVGPKPPRAKLMAFNVAVDDDARVKQLLDGKAGLIEDVPYREVENLQSKGFALDMKDSYSMPMIIFNTSHAPFNDVRIRKAILYAINEQKIIEDILHGNANIPESFLPKFDNTFHACKNVYNYDPQKAKELISAAGRPNLYFTLHANPNACVENFADQVRDDLSNVGITCNIKVEPINWGQYLNPYYRDDYDACLAALDPSVMGNDTDLILSTYFGESSVQKHITYFAESNPDAFEQLQNSLQEARTSTDQKQIDAWNNAQEIIAEHVPLYPLLHRKIVTAYNSNTVKGYEGNISSGLYMLDCAPVRK